MSIFNLKNEYEIPKFKAYVNKLFKERAVVEVKKKLPNRTLAQNSYLHLLLGYFGSEYGCSLEEAKIDFYKRTCNRDLFERKTVNKKGREVTYLRSSAELTTGEMTLSIDRFRNWSASVAGVYLPAKADWCFFCLARKTDHLFPSLVVGSFNAHFSALILRRKYA